MNDNKGQTIFLSVIGIATLLVAIVGATFAWFSATVTNPDQASNSVIITTATLGTVTFSNGAEISVNNIYPGWTATKTVSVTSDANATVEVPYVIKLNVAANGFATAGSTQGYIKYWFTSTGSSGTIATAVEEANAIDITATTGSINIISGTLPGESSVEHSYVIHFVFPEMSIDQNSQQGQTFSAYLSAHTDNRYTENSTNDGRVEYNG